MDCLNDKFRHSLSSPTRKENGRKWITECIKYNKCGIKMMENWVGGKGRMRKKRERGRYEKEKGDKNNKAKEKQKKE